MDWQLENRKALYLQRLYYRDGRDNRYHPLHGTYTGLYQQRMQELIEWERDKSHPSMLPTTKPA